MRLRPRHSPAALALLLPILPASLSRADVVYDIFPQALEHETNGSPQAITGGSFVVVDGADADGILADEEIVEVTVQQTMAGTTNLGLDGLIYDNTLTFVGDKLVGNFYFEDFAPFPGSFVDWGGGGRISISDEGMTEYASADWNPPFEVAPEPGFLVGLGAGVAFLSLSRRSRNRPRR